MADVNQISSGSDEIVLLEDFFVGAQASTEEIALDAYDCNAIPETSDVGVRDDYSRFCDGVADGNSTQGLSDEDVRRIAAEVIAQQEAQVAADNAAAAELLREAQADIETYRRMPPGAAYIDGTSTAGAYVDAKKTAQDALETAEATSRAQPKASGPDIGHQKN